MIQVDKKADNLKDGITTIALDDNVLKVNVSGMTAKIPILERHESNDAILRTSQNYDVNRDMEKGIAITPKTTLNTRIKVSTKELQEAMKSCEAVGNSIFQLENLSNKDYQITLAWGQDIHPIRSPEDDLLDATREAMRSGDDWKVGCATIRKNV